VDGEMGVAMPFSVKVLFSEPMFQTTVNDKTVKLFDAKGTELGISIAFEDEAGTKLAVTPTGAVFPASPYRLKLNPMMSDLAGNPLGVTLDISFYTGVVGLGPYKALAGKYAPLIYQATSEEHPEFDFLTRFDLDGDWVAKDNVDFMKTNLMKVESVVYYSVVETRSHYFITYVFYYPYRPVAGSEFGNDVSGATVVVRKLNEAPVAVETYFKQDNDERSLSFVVEGGGLVPDGQSAYDYAKFDEMYAGQDLFPNGHFVSYLSAGKHESCLWIDENNSTFDGCQLNAGIKDMMKKVEYQYTDGTAGEIAKAGGTFPPTAKTSYGLSHIVESWWARRTDVGEDKMWASAYKYVPFENTLYPDRPDLNDEIPSFFVDPIGNDNGRPPWAWKWNPQNGVTFYEMNRGVFFLDPAMHFKQRHDPAAMWKLWDGTDGWSADYCYNPYFNLDFRGIWPECSPKPE
jgi:hypothetical protein